MNDSEIEQVRNLVVKHIGLKVRSCTNVELRDDHELDIRFTDGSWVNYLGGNSKNRRFEHARWSSEDGRTVLRRFAVVSEIKRKVVAL